MVLGFTLANNVRHLEHPEIPYLDTSSLKSHKCIPGFHVQIHGFSYYNGLLFTPGSFSSHIIRTGWFLVFNFDFRALHPPNSFFFFIITMGQGSSRCRLSKVVLSSLLMHSSSILRCELTSSPSRLNLDGVLESDTLATLTCSWIP